MTDDAWPRSYSAQELIDLTPDNPTRWGPWRLMGYRLVNRPNDYLIDLSTCTSSAQVLDWLCQIADKSWATPEVLGNLTQAMHTILNPQSRLCSFGQDTRLTYAQVRAVVRAYRQESGAGR